MNKATTMLLVTFLALYSATAWPASTKQEVLELKEQVSAMQKDLAEIKALKALNLKRVGATTTDLAPVARALPNCIVYRR